jgi:DNA-binding PadR family transcriptional regulator
MNLQSKSSPNLPISEATFYILLSLAVQPRHGYAIMKDVQSLSGNRIVLATGTLYGALKRLLELGWVVRLDSADSAAAGRKRIVYRLTDLGRSVLDAEILRLDGLVTAARAHLLDEQKGGTQAPA